MSMYTVYLESGMTMFEKKKHFLSHHCVDAGFSVLDKVLQSLRCAHTPRGKADET